MCTNNEIKVYILSYSQSYPQYPHAIIHNR
jgi:hypothetical protein